MQGLRSISIHHHHFPLETIGDFSIADELLHDTLSNLRSEFGIKEIMYLGTCNRVEFIFTLPHFVCPGFTFQFLQKIQPNFSEGVLKGIASKTLRFNEDEAVEHLYKVASGIDSMIVGEQEIITQLRKAYEKCEALGHTGDDLRMLVQSSIRVGKEVYTETNLSKKPVSIASIAWNTFLNKNLPFDAKIVCVGAGQIIRNFVKFLGENNFQNVHVVNRSIENANEVAKLAAGKAHDLLELKNVLNEAKAVIVCTSSKDYLITENLLPYLTSNELIIDLALPSNVHPRVAELPEITFVDLKCIQQSIQSNMAFREEAIKDGMSIVERNKLDFKKMVQARNVERAMRAIPETIKSIKQTAVEQVFRKEIESLDEHSKQIVFDIIQYMEKKYISVPMKMAKDVLLEEISKN